MPAKHPSLWWRLMLALVLMAGFYVLALGLAAGLLYLPYAEYRHGRVLHIKLALLCLLGAGGILWGVLPRFDRFQTPGPRLDPDQQPRLFQELSGVAAAVGQPLPAEVYLVPEVNAWVANRGGIMGWGSRRIMGLGLPLLQVVSVSELRAVMVHEFGHFHSGDTALAPWVYKTRSAIDRTLARLGGSLLQKPFVWYARLFLRLTNAVARQQEYAADAMAVEVAGPGPMISGLQKLFQAGVAFEAFWESELSPLLTMGFRPPLAEGFQAFLSGPEVSLGMAEALREEMEESGPNSDSTHPALKERLAVLEGYPAPATPPDDRPALALIDNAAGLEEELLVALFGESARQFQEIAWRDTVARVFLPGWRETVRDHAQALSRVQLGALPDLAEHPEDFLNRFSFSPELSLEDKKAPASIIMGMAVAAALCGQGCQVANELGAPIKILLAGVWIAPFSLMADLAGGLMPADYWKELCARAGLSELNLGVLKDGPVGWRPEN